MLHAVIMAGGTGTRFWPASTEARPKQFLNIFGDRTMLQETVDRIEELIPAERVWVITNEKYEDLVAEQLPDVPTDNIVGEPVAKNTAPCVALAAALIKDRDPNGTMVVLPADHRIAEPAQFRSILRTAAATADREEALVTIGIQPTRPETGYGYIEFDNNGSNGSGNVKKVLQFREKPDAATAREFIDSGNFLWNSGMFIWKASTILAEFAQHLPEVNEQLEKLRPRIGTAEHTASVNEFYHGCPSISVDYGIMERARQVFVVPGSFGWNDVGSWKAVYELEEKDGDENVITQATAALTNSRNNLVKTSSDKIVALVGVDNLAVVETDNAILVCNLDEAQEVKAVVNQLRHSEDEDLKKYL